MISDLICENCGTRVGFSHDPNPENPFWSILGGFVKCHNCDHENLEPGTILKTNFEFSAVSGLLRDSYTQSKPKHRKLRKAYAAFETNMDRVIAFGRLPQLLQFQEEHFLATFDFGPNVDRLAVRPGHESLIRNGGRVAINPKDVDPRLAFVHCTGLAMALEGLLASMIIGTWTAFETLAGDLWEAAINAAPKRLALLGGQAKRIEKKSGASFKPPKEATDQANESLEKAQSDEDIPDRAVSLRVMNRLTGGTFDLRRLMGTLQRQALDFDTLSDIRGAYSRAFYKPASPDIDDSLADRSLDAIQLVRNLLVHRGGVADQKYLDKSKRLPNAPQLETNDRLNLTGAVVAVACY